MDTKTVAQELRKGIFKYLKDKGFSTRKGLKLWRSNNETVDVIRFHHFSKYQADVIGTETFSLGIEVGVFLKFVPDVSMESMTNRLQPDVSDCHFRGSLVKTISQEELLRRDVWHLREDNSNFTEVMADVQTAIQIQAHNWFNRAHNFPGMLEMLLNEEEEWDGNVKILGGFGRLNSPMRMYTSGYLALHLGKVDTASSCLTAALQTGCYDDVSRNIKKVIADCSSRR